MGNFIQPRSAKGTRDFSPVEMRLRKKILKTISDQFRLFGFEEIETPALENLETLTGKYGDEGDNLIFKILNSGDFLRGLSPEDRQNLDARTITPRISERALRYDLTVPFARYVVQHRNEITFPFRRYQIQPVWRADKPQKGRYREFYQCDADVIGSDSLLNEAELIAMMNSVFEALKIGVNIKINNRKILFGFCEALGIDDRFIEFTVLLDKLDKKPWPELKQSFHEVGFSEDVTTATEKLISNSGKSLSEESVNAMSAVTNLSETGQLGLDELKELASYIKGMNVNFANVTIDLSLARGLNYYTGAIFEVVASDVEIGSICGGGRYDNLTGMFGMEGVSGVGISFGIDRIFDILREKETEKESTNETLIVFANFGSKEIQRSLQDISKLREAGLAVIVYPESVKLNKQFKYADQRGASHMVSVGEEELKKGILRVKDLKTGEQTNFTTEKLIHHLKN